MSEVCNDLTVAYVPKSELCEECRRAIAADLAAAMKRAEEQDAAAVGAAMKRAKKQDAAGDKNKAKK